MTASGALRDGLASSSSDSPAGRMSHDWMASPEGPSHVISPTRPSAVLLSRSRLKKVSCRAELPSAESK